MELLNDFSLDDSPGIVIQGFKSVELGGDMIMKIPTWSTTSESCVSSVREQFC